MKQPTPADGYSYRAIEAMQRLNSRHQREIEWLRVNRLPLLAANGKAAVCNNHPDLRYRLTVTTTTLKITIRYYLNGADNTAVIYSIE